MQPAVIQVKGLPGACGVSRCLIRPGDRREEILQEKGRKLGSSFQAGLPVDALGLLAHSGLAGLAQVGDVPGGKALDQQQRHLPLSLVAEARQQVGDAASGEQRLGAHHFIEGATAESIQSRYTAWARTFARVVAELTLPPQRSTPLKPLQSLPVDPATPMVAPRGLVGSIDASAADPEAALRRIAVLRRDGLISEDEFQTLRKLAIEKAEGSSR